MFLAWSHGLGLDGDWMGIGLGIGKGLGWIPAGGVPWKMASCFCVKAPWNCIMIEGSVVRWRNGFWCMQALVSQLSMHFSHNYPWYYTRSRVNLRVLIGSTFLSEELCRAKRCGTWQKNIKNGAIAEVVCLKRIAHTHKI